MSVTGDRDGSVASGGGGEGRKEKCGGFKKTCTANVVNILCACEVFRPG